MWASSNFLLFSGMRIMCLIQLLLLIQLLPGCHAGSRGYSRKPTLKAGSAPSKATNYVTHRDFLPMGCVHTLQISLKLVDPLISNVPISFLSIHQLTYYQLSSQVSDNRLPLPGSLPCSQPCVPLLVCTFLPRNC